MTACRSVFFSRRVSLYSDSVETEVPVDQRSFKNNWVVALDGEDCKAMKDCIERCFADRLHSSRPGNIPSEKFLAFQSFLMKRPDICPTPPPVDSPCKLVPKMTGWMQHLSSHLRVAE